MYWTCKQLGQIWNTMRWNTTSLHLLPVALHPQMTSFVPFKFSLPSRRCHADIYQNIQNYYPYCVLALYCIGVYECVVLCKQLHKKQVHVRNKVLLSDALAMYSCRWQSFQLKSFFPFKNKNRIFSRSMFKLAQSSTTSTGAHLALFLLLFKVALGFHFIN